MKKGRLASLCLLVLALVFQYSNPGILQDLRHRVFDIYQQWLPRTPVSPRQVTIIDIDERSLLELGQWPWPRYLLGEMVNQAKDKGALVVGFDMLFAEEDRLSPENIVETLKDLPENVATALKSRESFDKIFAQAIQSHKVVLGISVSPDVEGANNSGYSRTANFAQFGHSPIPFLREYPALIGNISVLDAAAAGRGMLSLDQNFDGVVRRIPLANRVGDKILPTLTLDMLRVALNQSVAIKANRTGIEGFLIAGRMIPTDPQGRIWVKYAEHDPTQYISAYDLISGTADPELIKDRYLLVGTSATGLKDLRSSPLQASLPGVEMHAQLLENILENTFLLRADYLHVLEWAGTLLTCLTLIILVPLVGAKFTLAILLIVSSLASLSAAYFFVSEAILIDVVFTLAVSVGTYILLVYSSYLSTELERTQIRTAFAHYLSPDLVERLSGSPDKLVLGGEQRDMTFLFCDIRDFTSISETFQNDPQGLTGLINSFLTPMTDLILRHDGTIDKYMGDSIMAFWNAPLDNPNHARDAATSALKMISTLVDVNATLKEGAAANNMEFRPLKIGIGLNTGNCIVGNLGSEQRFDYSVIGDAVNLASRLEGQSKSYGFDIIIGEDTAREVPDYALLELDKIAVKGRSAATTIYALVGDATFRDTNDFHALEKAVSELLKHYQSRDWAAARHAAKFLLELDSDTKVFADLYLSRIEEFEKTPPPENWDGVFRATSK